MNILTKATVTNSEMIKNYKECRDKAQRFGKIFVSNNNKVEAVLFSITEYERLSLFIEYLEDQEDQEDQENQEKEDTTSIAASLYRLV